MSEEHRNTSVDAVDQDVLDGQAAYLPRRLDWYDIVVYKGTAPLAWRCSARQVLRLYAASVGARHLEIGVGSGYLLANTRFPIPDPEITLCDLNPHTLDHVERRLSQYRVDKIRANALDPLPVPDASYDSVGLNYLLHCIPGSLREKGVVLKHAAAAVRPGGVVFGSTVLSGGVPVSWLGRSAMRSLNKKGVFHNEQDHLDDLRAQLERNFASHRLVVRGCVGLFRAQTAG
ncbi:methyltransferase type 12 [Streptomyces albus subsp. albus]|nr:methyltransferase type 12 [Streptomyces albus subsp. albus]